MKTKLAFKEIPKTYGALIAFKVLRPIHDRIEYANALEVLETMAGHTLNLDQEDYFEALALFVETYESAHLPGLPAKKGLTLLKHLLEENNMSAADLARSIGVDRSLGVRILNGERNLTLDHIKKLASRFRVPAGVFIS
jgi:HTH-type transcriptional regulator / antitoxin HigA